MWWINKFGSISGPYSDEQIRRGIRQNQFTKLNKISSDRQTWMRLDETEFWNPMSQKPEEMKLPDFASRYERPGGALGDYAAKPAAESGRGVLASDGAPVVVAKKVCRAFTRPGPGLLIGGAVVVGCVVLACVLFAVLHEGEGATPTPTNLISSPKVAIVSTDLDASNFEKIKKRVVLIHAKDGVGTGFLVKMNGKKYVMSNDHVVRSVATPEMVLVDGTRLELGAFSVARDRDLARFEVDYSGECFEMGEKIPNNGDEVWIYGNSQGDDVITSLKGTITGVGSRVIKVDADFVPGNSGSPILEEGKVVGVASYLKNGDRGKDWTTKDTQFDQVRRFGIRPVNVEWVSINRYEYERECAKLKEIEVYWNYLRDYLICDNVTDEQYKTLYLVHKDIDHKYFNGVDGAAFHEMLMELSKSYARQKNSWSKWQDIRRNRSALIDRLNKAIGSNDLTLEDGKKVLTEFDADNKVDEAWENVKTKHRDFNAKRKEALLMAREFLTKDKWHCPLIEHGYSSENRLDSVDWYLEATQYFLDQNAQKLKDLNKKLETLEGHEDED